MDGKIREMTATDWREVSTIYTEALLEGKSTFQTECPTYEVWDKAHLKDCRYVILADDKVVGWCSISATSAREVYKGVVEVSTYFSKDYRRKGLGTKLLRYLLEESKKKGYWCLYASIFSTNIASIALYKKCGFREIGYRENIAKDRFGAWRNTTLFEKRAALKKE